MNKLLEQSIFVMKNTKTNKTFNGGNSELDKSEHRKHVKPVYKSSDATMSILPVIIYGRAAPLGEIMQLYEQISESVAEVQKK